MNIALTGASGFIGSRIAQQLHAQGHRVAGLVRKTSRRDHIEPVVDRFVVGEQDDPTAWEQLLDGADCIIHNSVDLDALHGYSGNPTGPAFVQHLRQNLESSLAFLRETAPLPFVFMSTIAVHHDMRARWEGMIDEDHPLRPASAYGAYKAAVEAHLWAEHFGSEPLPLL